MRIGSGAFEEAEDIIVVDNDFGEEEEEGRRHVHASSPSSNRKK
jgi:hypothetical protein